MNVRSFQPDLRFFALSNDTFSAFDPTFNDALAIVNLTVVSTKRRVGTKCNALLKTPIETAKTSSDVQRGTLKSKIPVDRLLGVKRFATRR